MTFIGQALKGRNTQWIWYVLGVVAVFIGYTIGQFPLMMLIESDVKNNTLTRMEADEFYQTLDFGAVGIPSYLGLLLILGSFLGALAVLYLYVKNIHGRSFSTVISTGKVRWERISFAFIVWLMMTAVMELVLYFSAPETYHFIFTPESWLPLMLVVLVLLPFQTSFEELFMRGYLMQRIGISVRKPWIAVLITSVLFGAMHLSNPEVRQFGIPVMMTYYISVGLFLAVLTILDDGLEFALGIHAATNIYGAGFVSFKGSALETDALFEVDTVNPSLMLVLFYVGAILFYLILRKKFKLASWKVLFRKEERPDMQITDSGLNF